MINEETLSTDFYFNSGSLYLIYSKNQDKRQYSVVVANCGACDTHVFVSKLLKSVGSEIESDEMTSSVLFDHTDGRRRAVHLIEVDSEKHDLWTSLNFDGCILLFSTNNAQSFKHAHEKLLLLKHSQGKEILWLVGIANDPALARRFHRIIASHEANDVARQCGAHYAEVVREGKTERCPLAYNEIITELIAELAQIPIKPPPQKITFNFDSRIL